MQVELARATMLEGLRKIPDARARALETITVLEAARSRALMHAWLGGKPQQPVREHFDHLIAGIREELATLERSVAAAEAAVLQSAQQA